MLFSARMNVRFLVRLTFAAVVASAGLLAQTPPLEKVRLQLKWQHQFQFAGYYAAVEKGYYREVGLDVELIEAVPERDPVENVLNGGAEFGVGNSDLLLLRAAGRPVVVLAAIFQHSPLLLVTRAASGVSDLQGLQDREMMIIDSEKAELFAYFKYEGVDVSRLRVRPHTLRLAEFINGQVDAMSSYSTDEPFELREAGVEFHAFTARSGGIDFYGDNLFTTEDQVRRFPERVRAFRAASLRGWEYALAHQEEIVDLIRRQHPERLSREHLLFEAAKTAELMHPGIIEVGHLNPGRWRHIADTYAEFGMLPREFDLTGFIYYPDPPPNLRWVYWSLAVLGVIAFGALAWALPLVRLNRRLQQEIAARRQTENELRHAKDAAESANLAKSRYLAVISHEVRTPVAGIVGLVHLLQAEAVAPHQRETLGLIERSAESLLRLIGELLDHSRIEEGRVEIEPAPLAVREFVRDLCELFRIPAQSKGLKLTYTVTADTPAFVVSDAQRLRQILSNLLANAVKFTPKGEISVNVSSAPAAAGRRLLRIRVSDTGIGIPIERQARLFTPYEQGDASIGRQFGGTGLGLAISQRLARLLGGMIVLESESGHGATFTLEVDVGEA